MPGAMIEFALPAVPLLLLVGALLFGRYPGLETAVRLSERIASVGRRLCPAQTRQSRPPRAPGRLVNGGLLLACSLSGRAPPS